MATAEQKMLAYFKSIGYEPHEKQLAYHKCQSRFRVVTAGRRFGKAVKLDTPILTLSGWTTMADIRIGDYVFGPDGESTRVVDKSEAFYGQTYEVVFDDESSIVTDAAHKWAIETYTMRRNRSSIGKPYSRWKNIPAYVTKTTLELAARAGRVKYPDSVVLTRPVQLPRQKLSVDPYVFGVWLGDGTTGQNELAAEESDAATYAAEFEKVGLGLQKKTTKYGWRILGLPERFGSKSVPAEYALSSVEQRLALLQGLMDTDGTLSNEQLQFDNSDIELVDLVEWLVNSLGGKGRRSDHVPWYRNEAGEKIICRRSYRFGFNVAFPVFRLQRKLDKQLRLRQGPQTTRRYIKSVSPIASVPVQCITVEREDGLWLVGRELVVTHNSLSAARDATVKHLLRPNTLTWTIGPCVDEETTILTQRGWLRFDEVREGDETLSINPMTGLSEWNVVEKVLRKPGTHRVVRMEGDSFSSLSTPDHRWITNRRPTACYKPQIRLPKELKAIAGQLPRTADYWTWRTTATLTADDRIPRSAPCTQLPTEAKYTDEFVELVAWIWTEGSLARVHRQTQTTFTIHQSHTVNPENVARIRRALVASNAGYCEYCDVRDNTHMTHFELYAGFSRELWKAFSSHKMVRPEFVRTLTRAQLKLFVDVSILADGNQIARQVYQSKKEQLFAVQLACSLLGWPTSLHAANGEWRLSLLANHFVNPKRAVYNAGPEGMQIQEEEYVGTVWCVTTRNGNWLASRNGTVYYTGNTYILAEKEFRAIWMDLIVKKGFGKDRRVKKAYAIRSGDMHIAFPWGAKIEAKSAEHPDLLVGESLDHVILAEAAKHRKETWERYVRPSLSDKRGSADFVSTPEGQNWFYDLYLQGLDPTLPEYTSFKFPSWFNDKVYPGGRTDSEILLLEKTMDPEWFKQEIGADFASFAGKIFPDWDESVHLREHTFNPNWKNYLTIDFGYTNPMALVEFQVSPSDQIYVWRVTYKKYRTVTDICREHMELPRPDNYHLDLGFGDPADPEGVAVATKELGVHVMAPPDLKQRFTWLDGIMLMRQLMKPDREIRQDEYGTPYYEPSFFVDPRCTPVVKEMANYRSKAPVKGQNVPELGQKIEDHTIDAIRYALLCIFKLGAVYSLADIYGTADIPELSPHAAMQRAIERDAPVPTGTFDNFELADLLVIDEYEPTFSSDRGTFTKSMEF